MNKIYDVNSAKYCIDSYQAGFALRKYLSTCKIEERQKFKP